MKKYYSIINVLFFTIVALLLLTSLVFGYIWIRSEYSQFQKASEESIVEYLAAQKSLLRSDVDRTMEYIRFMTTRTEEILKENTRGRTNEALSVAWNIYDKFNKVRSDNEIKEMIREALRPIRYSDGRGYFFIDRLDGVNVLYPVFPESEGQNILNLRDEKGNYVLKDEINMVKRHGEGFVTGYWKKPSQGNDAVYLKISFVKLFKPFGWSIGTGEYLDDVEKKIQQDIFDMVSGIHTGTKNDQHLFIHDFDGVMLADAGNPDMVGKNLWEMLDAQGKKVVQEQIRLARQNPEGAFLYRQLLLVENDQMPEKMTFVMAVPEWKWVVGASASTDEIRKSIAGKREELKNQIRERIITIAVAIFILILLALFVLSMITSQIYRSYSIFSSFFEKASSEYSEIDLDQLNYSEFRELAVMGNKMLQERTRMENGIREMNEFLQTRVQDQTREFLDLSENIESRIDERTMSLKKLTDTDGLTGLYNRRYVFEKLDSLDEDKRARNRDVSVIMLDLDHFKKINDTYGHPFGDRVLKKVGETIMKQARSSDLAGRYGGEEFIVVLPGTDLENGVMVAERICEGVRNIDFGVEGLVVTISGGVAQMKAEGETTAELIDRTDKLLYSAKKKGRNRIES